MPGLRRLPMVGRAAPRALEPMRVPRQDLGANALAASLTFALAVALFTLGGWWLDEKLGTRVVFVIVGFLVGAAGGMLHLITRLAPGMLPFGRRRSDGGAARNAPATKPPASKDPAGPEA